MGDTYHTVLLIVLYGPQNTITQKPASFQTTMGQAQTNFQSASTSHYRILNFFFVQWNKVND